ncbi:DUF3467 domain-containing protein [Streptantibioticus ferralitis]|uniref:DUF3467 domain-containing protein n=1 Tax=Streptantibioticus ferralitis TaxID=236510 RepID=A0ABT5Z0S0_9ACTN|nr:DUF3467 domain-containing protein [Streptantibioticus ferralitis]MDF2257436.1 DUF3467 domain-containing protein [Streptantibioticus ferralitis]
MAEPSHESSSQRVEFEIPVEAEAGTYADIVAVWHTPDIFVLDFAAIRRAPTHRQDPDTDLQVTLFPVKLVSRVRVPPSQVFEIMKALSQHLAQWEAEMGQTEPE